MTIKTLAKKFRLWAEVLEELSARKYLTDDGMKANETEEVAEKIRRRVKRKKRNKPVVKDSKGHAAKRAAWTPERRERQRRFMAKMKREGRGVFSKQARAKNLKARGANKA